MTRPKVDPDKRQRTAQACDSCKRRKQKVKTVTVIDLIDVWVKRADESSAMANAPATPAGNATYPAHSAPASQGPLTICLCLHRRGV